MGARFEVEVQVPEDTRSLIRLELLFLSRGALCSRYPVAPVLPEHNPTSKSQTSYSITDARLKQTGFALPIHCAYLAAGADGLSLSMVKVWRAVWDKLGRSISKPLTSGASLIAG